MWGDGELTRALAGDAFQRGRRFETHGGAKRKVIPCRSENVLGCVPQEESHQWELISISNTRKVLAKPCLWMAMLGGCVCGHLWAPCLCLQGVGQHLHLTSPVLCNIHFDIFIGTFNETGTWLSLAKFYLSIFQTQKPFPGLSSAIVSEQSLLSLRNSNNRVCGSVCCHSMLWHQVKRMASSFSHLKSQLVVTQNGESSNNHSNIDADF